MSCGPVLHFCQVPSKYSKGYSRYRADKKFYAYADANANRIFACGGGGGGHNLLNLSWIERTRNLFQIKQRVITPKIRMAELSILYATCRLALSYISTKSHQNIPKGIQVTEQTRSFTLVPMLTPTRSLVVVVVGHNLLNLSWIIKSIFKEYGAFKRRAGF